MKENLELQKTINSKSLGILLRQQRRNVLLTLGGLSAQSGVSPSHLGRVERGERFPSAQTLRKIAKPLGFSEVELLTIAGYLSPQPPIMAESSGERRLDPLVATVLSQEPVETQRAIVTLINILKIMAKHLHSPIL